MKRKNSKPARNTGIDIEKLEEILAPVIERQTREHLAKENNRDERREKNVFGRLEKMRELEIKIRDIKLGKSHLAIAQN